MARREHLPCKDGNEKPISFSEGLMAMSVRGTFGPRVNMTKRRARAIEYLCDQMVYCVPEFTDGRSEDDYHAGIEWIRQQIQKRYSRFALAKD